MNKFKSKEDYLEFLNNSSNKELLNSLESNPDKLLKELKGFYKELDEHNKKIKAKNESRNEIFFNETRGI